VNTISSPTYGLAKYVARKLSPIVGHIDSFIKDSYDFLKVIKEEKLDKDELIIIFDVVSLSTKIPLEEAIKVLYEVTNAETAKLVEICLCSKLFSF